MPSDTQIILRSKVAQAPRTGNTTQIAFKMTTSINHNGSHNDFEAAGLWRSPSPSCSRSSRTRAIAIKSRGRTTTTTNGFNDENEAAVVNAERMYDNATWQMYNRIVQYRKAHPMEGEQRRSLSEARVSPTEDDAQEKHSHDETAEYYDMEDAIFDMEL